MLVEGLFRVRRVTCRVGLLITSIIKCSSRPSESFSWSDRWIVSNSSLLFPYSSDEEEYAIAWKLRQFCGSANCWSGFRVSIEASDATKRLKLVSKC